MRPMTDAAPQNPTEARLPARKRIALVAHDNKKDDLIEWAQFNRGTLSRHNLVATGTTGRLLQEQVGLDVKRLHSGPLGGDMQLGAMISEGEAWYRLSPRLVFVPGFAVLLTVLGFNLLGEGLRDVLDPRG